MKTARWALLFLVLTALAGAAFGANSQETNPYITAGPVVQGIPQPPENWATLSYNGFVFDTRAGEPALPAGLRISAYPAGTVGYYLVTLKVPVTEAVKGELISSGAKLISFMPFNSFLVAMDEATKARVASSPAVSWVGIFQPAYKVASWFNGLTGSKDVFVQLFPDEDVNLAAAKLRGMGLGSVSIEPSKLYKILKVRMDMGSVAKVAGLREVMWTEPWPEYILVNKDAQWTTQTNFPNLRRLWDRGVNGSGEVVNTADTGIRTTQWFFYDSAYPINNAGDFPNHRKIISYQVLAGAAFGDVAAASYHGTHTAGTICGDDSYNGGTDPNDGMAIKDKMYFCDIGDAGGGLGGIPADLTNLYTPPFNGNSGGAARVSSHSWGYTSGNNYTANCQQTDNFMWGHRDFVIFFAGGNSGPGANTVRPPGTAKDIVTLGASFDGAAGFNLAGFSSRGPCDDTRRKPTVCAPGVGIMSANGAVDQGVQAMQGTSMATPCAAGNGALVRNYFRKGFYPTGDSVVGNRWSFVSAALVKAVLVNSANNDFPRYTIPDNNIGWGRINLDNTLYFSGDARKLAVYEDSLSATQSRQYNVDVNTDAEPLKITMVYTDYPAAAGANPAIINNLNLTVTGGGQTYLGNVFSGGWSTTGGAADVRNMEECVFIRQPARGTWTITVNAPTVPNGPQPFALVVTGGLGTIGAQVLSLRANTILDNLAGTNGNNNGMVDIGETVGFVDTIYNGGAAAVTAVTATLRTSDPQVMFNHGDSIANLGNIASGATANNGATPFKLVVRGSPRTVMFTLHLVGTLYNLPYTNDIQFPVRVGLGAGEIVKVITPRVFQDSSHIYGIAYDGTNLWVSTLDAAPYTSKIFKVNPNTGDTLPGSFVVNASGNDSLTDLAWEWGGNLLWSHALHNRRVYVLNTGTRSIVRQFASRATSYPIGLELRPNGLGGSRRDTLWEVDRNLAIGGAKAYYKCDTLGNQLQSFTGAQIPAYLAVPAGPRCLAYEPQGPNGGTLLHTVTEFDAAGSQLIGAHLYEIRQNGTNLDTVQAVNHHYIWGWNIRAVERDSGDWNYWISTFENSVHSNIYKVKGFYDKPLPPSGAELGPVALPTSFALGQSYPNPMVGGAMIKYALPRDVAVSLKVYNVSGQLVKTLVSGTEKAGYKQVSWEGRSEQGHRVSAGVYFYRMQAGDFTATKKLVVVR